jgi:hypothetical protein
MKQICILPVALVLFTACGKDLSEHDINVATPIVESYLQAGDHTLKVKLYSMEIYLHDEYILSKPIGGLDVRINGRELEETTSGLYSLDLGNDTIRSLEEYSLQFEHGGKTIRASTLVPPPVTGLTITPTSITRSTSSYWSMDADTVPIVLSWDNPDNAYFQVYVDASNTTSSAFDTNFRRRMMQPVQAGSHTMSLMDFRSAGNYSISVYRVNKEYVELYERISSSDLSNPVSFIDNALGIFTAMSVGTVAFTVSEE